MVSKWRLLHLVALHRHVGSDAERSTLRKRGAFSYILNTWKPYLNRGACRISIPETSSPSIGCITSFRPRKVVLGSSNPDDATHLSADGDTLSMQRYDKDGNAQYFDNPDAINANVYCGGCNGEKVSACLSRGSRRHNFTATDTSIRIQVSPRVGRSESTEASSSRGRSTTSPTASVLTPLGHCDQDSRPCTPYAVRPAVQLVTNHQPGSSKRRKGRSLFRRFSVPSSQLQYLPVVCVRTAWCNYNQLITETLESLSHF